MALLRGAYGTQVPDDEPPSTRGGTGTTSDRKPLGVPAGYTVPVPRSWTPSPGRSGRVNLAAARFVADQGPRYMDGDEWRPAGEGPEAIALKQRALVMAGYIGPRDRFRLGSWDETTRDAYRSLLEDANAAGLTAEAMVNQRAASIDIGTTGEGGGGPGTYIDPATGEIVEAGFVAPPLQLQLPNKADVEKVLRASVIDKLGVGWSQDQISQLADLYIGQVRGVQENAYRQEIDRMEDEFYGRPGQSEPITTVEAPSLETFAEDELRRRDPGGYQATQVGGEGGYADQFFAALGGFV